MGYARARWLDTRNAAWLTEDPLLDIDSPNLYAFVAWRPSMGTDPRGLETKEEWQALLKKDMMNRYGVDLDDWDPSRGFTHNQEIVEAVYQWYRDMHRENDYMHWTGLARMVGAPVVQGLEQSRAGFVVSFGADPVAPGPLKVAPPAARYYVRVLQRGFLTINRDIFMDLAWHHKAYAEKGINEIEERRAAEEIDINATTGWRLVDQGWRVGDSEKIWQGNLLFAYREQSVVVNPGYSILRSAPGLVRIMSELAQSPVPGGRRFDDVADQPSDISGFFGQRWKWLEQDMWPACKAMSREDQLHYTQMPLGEITTASEDW